MPLARLARSRASGRKAKRRDPETHGDASAAAAVRAGRSRVHPLLRLDDEGAGRSRASRDGRGELAAGAQARAARTGGRRAHRDARRDSRSAAIGGCRWRAPCAGRSTSSATSIRGSPTAPALRAPDVSQGAAVGCCGRSTASTRCSERSLARLMRFLQAWERAIPVSPVIREFLEARRPDAVIVSPLIDAASDQVDVARAAQARRHSAGGGDLELGQPDQQRAHAASCPTW